MEKYTIGVFNGGGWDRISYTDLKPSDIIAYINNGWRFSTETRDPKHGLYRLSGSTDSSKPLIGSPEQQLVVELSRVADAELADDDLNKMLDGLTLGGGRKSPSKPRKTSTKTVKHKRCKKGSRRNPKTKRCNKKCLPKQKRNPKTRRCVLRKKLRTSSTNK
jgi:hypothetical protein